MTSLFDPIVINGVTIPNRIVKSAMGEGLCDERGYPLAGLARLYERWARGGVGLAITGMAHVRRGYSVTDKEIGLYDDALIASLQRVTEAVHRHDGRIFAQICHAPPQLPRATARRLGAVAPSPRLSPTNFLWHRALRDDELASLVVSFGAAARRAREAGFDGVQLHGAHGYLLSRMISPRFNQRKDGWGGSFERRLAFLEAVYRSVRHAVGDDYPVTIKLNAHDGGRHVNNGLDLAGSLRVGQHLQQWGVDAIEVSAGTADIALSFYPNRGEVPADLSRRFLQREFPWLRPVMPLVSLVSRQLVKQAAFEREAYFLREAERFAEALSIPVICVGGIRSREMAERIVNGKVAMVSLARPLVRQPALPRSWQSDLCPVASCTSCNRCFIEVGLGAHLRCYCRQ